MFTGIRRTIRSPTSGPRNPLIHYLLRQSEKPFHPAADCQRVIPAWADAVTLATFYANEAVRLHAAAVVPAHVADAEQMRGWLLNARTEEHISAAVAARLGPFKLTERSRKALALLETYGWLVKADGSVVDGRPHKEAWKVARP